MQVAVMTMVRNEAVSLPRWLRYYGDQVGPTKLVVLDDQSDDGSVDGIDATVFHLPIRATGRRPNRRGSAYDPSAFRKTGLANNFGRALLDVFDVVIFTDVDEFIVPDPRRYRDLPDFLEQHPGLDVIAPVGLNLTHVPALEPALQQGVSLLEQRRHVKFLPNMCKPAIKRADVRWTAGTHGCEAPYEVRDDLFLFHTKFADRDELMRAHRARHAEFLSSGAGPRSTWAMSPEEFELASRSWSTPVAGSPAAEFDPAQLDLADVVRPAGNGSFKSGGRSASRSMELSPLLRLPDYLSDQI